MARNSREHGGQSPSPFKSGPVRVIHPLKLWLVCTDYAEVVTHWNGVRTLECVGHYTGEVCAHCMAEFPRNLEYWVAVQDERRSHKPRLLKLTPGAIESCPDLTFRRGDLWGRVLKVWRTGNRWNGPMEANLENVENVPALADPVDVLKRLRKMWAAPTRFHSSTTPNDGEG